MSRRAQSSSRARRALGLLLTTCSTTLSACINPFNEDPRFERIGRQLEEAASAFSAERAAEVFEPSAPMVTSETLGKERAAMAVRVVASSGYRPDLSTAEFLPDSRAGRTVGSTAANSQTILLDGAVRLLPGIRVSRLKRYTTLGVDALARVAVVPTSAPGDESNALAVGYGARVGLVSDSAKRHSLSLSFMKGTLSGGGYDATVNAAPPATSALASFRVEKIRVSAVRLQGSTARGAWGLTAGIGANYGTFGLYRRAELNQPPSSSMVEGTSDVIWEHGLWNIGITRRLHRADLALQYGQASASTGATDPTETLRNTGPRRSVSLGVQMRH